MVEEQALIDAEPDRAVQLCKLRRASHGMSLQQCRTRSVAGHDPDAVAILAEIVFRECSNDALSGKTGGHSASGRQEKKENNRARALADRHAVAPVDAQLI
jgi:hypothetical protein